MRRIVAIAGLSLSAVSVVVAWAPPVGAQALPAFYGVGDLPGGTVDSTAVDVSADGSTVVGSSEGASGLEAFTWTVSGGAVGLGFLSGVDPLSEATAISGDGSFAVGTSLDSSSVERAVRWSVGGGITALGTFSCSSCDPETVAWGISDDGLVTVGGGLARSALGNPHFDAARWPGGGTAIDDLGDLPGPANFSSANDTSANGAVIVGTGESNAGTEGWWWTSSNNMTALAGVPGALIRSSAQGISADASVIVGSANTSATETGRLEAVRWTGSGYGTVELLGKLPGVTAADSEARDVTSDGAIVVGRAVNAQNNDRAFLWDAANGMRELAVVLATDYGLDTTGWVLRDAMGVSDVAPDGSFTVVGTGTNPNGDPEGWVAFLAVPVCRNGLDDDGDTLFDFPDDPGCTSPIDYSELDDCSDGLDNDGDGNVDFPADAGCRAADDPTERFDCSDGLDNDGDGNVDHPADAGCASPDGPLEDPACDDGQDNDVDGDIDFPADTDCVTAADLSEVPDCSDGLDNDGDGNTDLADPDCTDAGDASEAPQCSDGLDNDGDGRTDYPFAYPSCVAANDPIEAPQCGDGVDNDGDGDVDLADADCTGPGDLNEASLQFSAGDLLVLDRTSRALFAVDPATGSQTLLSQAGLLSDPQGVGQTASGVPVVADPAGLVEIDPFSGAQRLASDPLAAGSSLQIVFDASGDVFVLEATAISQVAWNPAGVSPVVPFLTLPTMEMPFPQLTTFIGDTLAMESSGNLLTSGASFFVGDGVYRVDVSGPSVALIETSPDFDNNVWLDLAVEQDGTILGVGAFLAGGPGIYRIDPASGVPTPLSVGAPWQTPTGVARAPAGDIYVADAGDCSTVPCTGGEIVRVDPMSGARTSISSGGFVQGELDLEVALPEPGELGALVAGVLALMGLARLRRRG